MALYKFLRGSSANLANVTVEDGTFYLTTDTHRLYVGQGTDLCPVNEGVTTVANVEGLPETAVTGSFYYATEENILCVYNGQTFVQINPDTDTGATSVAFEGEGNVIVGVTYDATTRTLTFQKKQIYATDVVFEENLMFTKTFGKYAPTSAGYVEIPVQGKTVQDLFTMAYSEPTDPTVDYPSITISASGGSAEVGNTFTLPTATLKVDDIGSYQYGSKDTAGTKYDSAETGVVYKANAIKLAQGADPATATHYVENENQLVKDGTITLTAEGSNTTYGDSAVSFTFSGSATYSNDSDREPLNNLGTKVSTKKIPATGTTTIADKTVSFTGYRKCFWGFKSVAASLANPEAITSEQVRALQKSGNGRQTMPTSYTVDAGTKQVYFLAPAGAYKTLSIKNASALSAPVACAKKANAVKVEGANSYTAVDYDLWYVNLDSSFSGSANLTLTWTK